MSVRERYQALSLLQVELEVQSKLPPGFRVFGTRWEGPFLAMEFTYCDRHKYIMFNPEGDKLDEVVQILVEQIELTPLLDLPVEDAIYGITSQFRKLADYPMSS